MADETLIVETPEHVELHFALATVGNRFLACAIDHSIQIIALTLTSWIAWRLSEDVRQTSSRIFGGTGDSSVWVMAVGTLITFVILFGYFILFETFWNGQTPGKRWLKLRVIQDDGRPVTFFSSFARNLMRSADIMPLPFYSVGLISAFASARAKRIGDYIANTVVIKERESEAPAFEEVFEHEIIDSALRRIAPAVEFRGDVGVVSSSEILAVEMFLRRRYDIPEQPRMWLAWRIAAPLIEKIKPQYQPENFNFEGFLEELLARHRTLLRYRQ